MSSGTKSICLELKVTTRPMRHKKGSSRVSKGQYCQRDKTHRDPRRWRRGRKRMLTDCLEREEREKEYVPRLQAAEEKYAAEVELAHVYYEEEL